jgi:hypothetical protein
MVWKVSQAMPARIVDPGLLGFGVAAGRFALFDNFTTRLVQTRVDFVEFVLAFNLDAEVIEAGLPSARRDREIDPRVFQHPFGVVRLYDRGLRGEQRGIEPNRMLKVLDGHVNVQTLHHKSSSIRQAAADSRLAPSWFRNSSGLFAEIEDF